MSCSGDLRLTWPGEDKSQSQLRAELQASSLNRCYDTLQQCLCSYASALNYSLFNDSNIPKSRNLSGFLWVSGHYITVNHFHKHIIKVLDYIPHFLFSNLFPLNTKSIWQWLTGEHLSPLWSDLLYYCCVSSEQSLFWKPCPSGAFADRGQRKAFLGPFSEHAHRWHSLTSKIKKSGAETRNVVGKLNYVQVLLPLVSVCSR